MATFNLKQFQYRKRQVLLQHSNRNTTADYDIREFQYRKRQVLLQPAEETIMISIIGGFNTVNGRCCCNTQTVVTLLMKQ